VGVTDSDNQETSAVSPLSAIASISSAAESDTRGRCNAQLIRELTSKDRTTRTQAERARENPCRRDRRNTLPAPGFIPSKTAVPDGKAGSWWYKWVGGGLFIGNLFFHRASPRPQALRCGRRVCRLAVTGNLRGWRLRYGKRSEAEPRNTVVKGGYAETYENDDCCHDRDGSQQNRNFPRNNFGQVASPGMSHELETGSDVSNEAPRDFDDVLRRVRAGDELAASEVVRMLYAQVRRIVLAHLPRRDDPEDLMQEVFLKVFSRLDQFRGKVPFENWVARVTLFTCLDRLRRQQTRPELRWADLSEEQQAMVAGVADECAQADASREEARELLDKLLAALKPEEQLLIRWLDIEQKSITEVCALTGWNKGVTRIRSFRARQKLRAQYRRLEKQVP
jgi:RNA polymerase sigma factor (sigma-70 family)